MKNKIIAVTLITAMIFGFTSCKKKNKQDEPTPKDEQLVVEIEEVKYNESDISGSATKVTELAGEFARVFGYAEQIGDDEIKEIEDTFRNDIIPLLIDIKIYPSELTSLLTCAEECLELADKEDGGAGDPEIFSDLYNKFVAVLDAERLGALVYELDLLMLAEMADDAQEKYDNLGYPFYLEDVKYYNDVIEDAKRLGRTKFASAISVITFTASAFNGSADFEDGGVSISVADTADIMKKQGEKFASLELSSDEWKIVAQMCEMYIQKNVPSGLKGKVLLSLDDSDFFVESVGVMPDLIKFYAKVTSDISKGSINLIEQGEKYAYERAVCTEILKNKAEFEALLVALEVKIPDANEECIDLVNTYAKKGYTDFILKYNANANDLISSISTFASAPTEQNYNRLLEVCIGYAARINSVVTYVYLFA